MNKLKEYRIKNNYSQEKLAYETGVTLIFGYCAKPKPQGLMALGFFYF